MRDITKTVPREQEEESTHRLVTHLAPMIEQLRGRWGGEGEYEVDPGSSLAGDDTYSTPYHVSHAAWLSIGHAIDNLAAMRDLTVRGEPPSFNVVTYPYAAYPLIRAALENASAALWLLGPTDRNTRLTRRFRAVLTNATHRDKAVELLSGQPSTTRATILESLRPLANARGLDLGACEKPVGYRELIRAAAEVSGEPEDDAVALWSILSGLTHGDPWATLAMSDRDEVQVHGQGGVVTVRMTSSVSNVVNTASLAASKARRALELFNRRRAAPFTGGL